MEEVNNSAFLYKCNACNNGKPCSLVCNQRSPKDCPFSSLKKSDEIKSDWKLVGKLFDPHKQFEVIIQEC